MLRQPPCSTLTPSFPTLRCTARNGEFALPRVGIESESQSWDYRLLQANFSFADGRVLSGAGRGRAPSPIDNEGKPSIIGAGSLQFRCVEPFQRWTMCFDGPARDGHVAAQIDGSFKAKPLTTKVTPDVEMPMATPDWGQAFSSDN